MNYLTQQIVFQEIPDEISLSFLICGCPLRCKGCHSADSWSEKSGQQLTLSYFLSSLERVKGIVSCILFLGGEWHESELLVFLQIARLAGFKTALYSGHETVRDEIKLQLDYLKTGSYVQELGGLDSPRTNQRLMHLKTNTQIHFKGEQHAEAQS